MLLALHVMLFMAKLEGSLVTIAEGAHMAASGVATWLKRTCRAGDLLSQSYA